ncbi:hypothetical protein DPMN_014430 [Dreissena polymorpha]|uniref:Voltage-gated hydrogen channel 1 n=1 Tax=Dreissena polymorpha TaxID=45954 RepID=A0A9D4N9L3_DREPO|nr:hypothetical protein DPMN_014430 [Dreissena polymorpha]
MCSAKSKSEFGYLFEPRSLRGRLLKVLHCRRMLIFVCVLIVLECLCVMAELMIDLHSLRVRFDHEELEIKKLINEIRSDASQGLQDIQSTTDLLKYLRTRSLTEKNTNRSACEIETRTTRSLSTPELFSGGRAHSTVEVLRRPGFHNRTDVSDKHEMKGPYYRSLRRGGPRTYAKLTRYKSLVQTNEHSVNNINESPNETVNNENTQSDASQMTTVSPKSADEQRSNVIEGDSKSRTGHLKTNQAAYIFEKDKYTEPIADKYTEPIADKTKDEIKSDDDTDRSVDGSINKVSKRSSDYKETIECSVVKNFVFSFQTDTYKHFYIRSFDELDNRGILDEDEFMYYQKKYGDFQKAAHFVKYLGFAVVSVMMFEIALKFICLGSTFFRKKIEVFDVCIVIISFVLDVVFIDSKWYESRKDATTILVLLMPWRVVRIVNSFLMTINHKHHIEMLTLRRAKKRVDLKLKKLRHLMLEMRRDIDLLIGLAKQHGATEPEIVNCIYGQGRGTKSLAAITGLASLMFISTLGKEPNAPIDPNENNYMYNMLIKEILSDEEDADNSDPFTMDTTDTKLECEEAGICMEEKDIRPQHVKEIREVKKIRRRVTLPRRHRSCSDDEKAVYYINDGYDVTYDVENTEKEGTTGQFSRRDNNSVKSMPYFETTQDGKSILTFEFTTQVSYL